MEEPTLVIIGGGLGGAKAAEALRDRGYAGPIVLVSEENHLPYERPPLSKDYLAGEKSLASFTTLDSDWYHDHDIDLRLGTRATAIDRSARRVLFADGASVPFGKVLLATGSRSRRPDLAGCDAAGVDYLRTVDDASVLKAKLADCRSLAVVGGGWIGLEVAAVARQRGVRVTVVEMAAVPLMGALGEEAGAVFAEMHRDHGVDLRLNAKVSEITTKADVARGIRLADGSLVDADAVLVAAGAQPNIELAERAGLETAGGGVVVDAALRSSDPDIFAVGDVAAAWNPVLGARVRTEHWANALKQPAVAAAGMLGTPGTYDELPYFFTDQYDLAMEYVGFAPDYRRVVFRGDVSGREFIAFWLDEADRILAAMAVNVWDVLDDIKALIRGREAVDTDRLRDDHQPIGELLSA